MVAFAPARDLGIVDGRLHLEESFTSRFSLSGVALGTSHAVCDTMLRRSGMLAPEQDFASFCESSLIVACSPLGE